MERESICLLRPGYFFFSLKILHHFLADSAHLPPLHTAFSAIDVHRIVVSCQTPLGILLSILCIADINECQSLPCQNGGDCFDDINRYSCSCPVGYTGVQCETGKSVCCVSSCSSCWCMKLRVHKQTHCAVHAHACSVRQLWSLWPLQYRLVNWAKSCHTSLKICSNFTHAWLKEIKK